MESSLISVVIPCYRCEDSIERAVLSVIRQTYTNWEIILVEDCSNDNNRTKSKLQNVKDSYSEYPIHLYFLEKNGGPSVARNRGMDEAKGDYIAFLDSDDSWHSNKLSIQIDIMLKNPEYLLSTHNNEIFSGEETAIIYETIKFNEIYLKQMLVSNRISTRTVMMHKNIKARFNEQMRYAEDFRLWMEIIESGYRVVHIDEVLAYSYKEDFGESGLSAKLWSMEKGELSTFKYLRNKNTISAFTYCTSVTWSFIKYIRRLVLVKVKF